MTNLELSCFTNLRHIDTVTVTVQSPPKEKIIYKNEVIVQESDCVDFYSDRKLDSLWTGSRTTKKNSTKR